MNFSAPPINNGGKIISNSPLLQYNPNFQNSQAQFQQQIHQQQQLLANFHHQQQLQQQHHHPFLLNADGAAAAAAAYVKNQLGDTGNQNPQKSAELYQESSFNYKGDVTATTNNNNNGIPAKPKDTTVQVSSSSQNHLPHLNGFAQRYMAEMELVRRRFMQQEQQHHHHQISSNNGGGAENCSTAVNLTQVSVPPTINNYLVDKRDRTSLSSLVPARLSEEQLPLAPAPADTRLKPATHIKNSLVDANFLPNPTPLQQTPSTPYHPQPQPSYLAMNPYMAAAAAAAALYHHPGIMMPPSSHLTRGPAAAQFLSASSNQLQQHHATNDLNLRDNLPYTTVPETISPAALHASNNSLHKNNSKSSNKTQNHNSCAVATGAENEDLTPLHNPSSHNKISTTTFIPPLPQNNDNHHQGGYYAVPADVQQQQQSMMAFAAAAAAAQRQYLQHQQQQQQQQHFLMNNLMAAAVAAGAGGGRRPITPVPNGTGITGTSPNLLLNHSQQQHQPHNISSNNALTAPQDPTGLFLPPYNAAANGSFVTPQAYMAAFAAAAAAAATPSGIFPLNPHHHFGGFPYPVAAAAQPPFSPYFGPGYYFPTPTNGSSHPQGFSATNHHHPILPPSQQQLTYDDNNYGVPLGGLMGGGSGVWNHPSTPFLPHHHAQLAASMLPIPHPFLGGENGNGGCGEATFGGLNYLPGITSLAAAPVGDHKNLTAASIATPTTTNKRKSSSSNMLEENGKRYSPPPLTPTISSHHSKGQYTTPTTTAAATKPGVGANKRGAAVSAFNDNVHPFFAIPPFAPPLFSVQVRTSCGSGAGNGCNDNSFFTASSSHIPLHHHHLTCTSNTLACPPATATAVSSSIKKQRNASPRQPRNSVDSSNKRPIDPPTATTPLSNMLPSSFKTPKRRSRTPLQNEYLNSPNLSNKQPSPLIKNTSNTSSYTTPNNNNNIILDLSSPTMICAGGGGIGVKASCSRPASVATTPRAAVAKQQQQRNTPLSNCFAPSTTNLYPNTGVGTTTTNCTNATLKNCKEPAELQLRNSPQQQQHPPIPVHTNRFASAKKLIIEEIHRLDTYLDMLESRLGLLNRAKTDMSSELNCRLTGNPSNSNNGSVESLNRKNFSSLHVKLAHAQRKLYELSGHLVKDTVYSHNREISHKSHIQISSKYQPSQSLLLPPPSQDKIGSNSLPTSSSQSADVASIPINNNKLVDRNTVNQAEISEKCIQRLNDLDPRTDQWTLNARGALSSRISLVKRLSHGKYQRFEQTYREKFETWYESVTKSKKIAKRRNRDAKAREFFENQYPELRDDRLERERLRRIWTRNTCGNYARTETDVEEISKRLLEQEEEKKRLYNLSAAIPVMLSCREKELERRTVYIDPLKVVPTVKHFSFTCPRYREFQRPIPLPNDVNLESDNKVLAEPTDEINNNSDVLTSISLPPQPLPSTATNTCSSNDIVVSAVSAAPKDLVYDFTENEEIMPQISTTTEQQLPDNSNNNQLHKPTALVHPDTTLSCTVPTTADNEEEKENRILDDEQEIPCCPNHDKEEYSILLPLELRRIRNVHYNPWTVEEHDVFKKSYTAHPKEFDFISRDIGSRKNVQDCVLHYYRTKKEENYKKMVARRKIANKKRKINTSNNNNNNNSNHNSNTTNILNNNANSCSNNNKITINCNSTATATANNNTYNTNSIIPCSIACTSAGRQSPSFVAPIRTRNSRLLPPAPTLLLIHQNNTTTNEESNDGTDSNNNFITVTSSSPSSNLVVKFPDQSIIQPSSSTNENDDIISADNLATHEPKSTLNPIFSNLSEQLPTCRLLNSSVVESTCLSHCTTTITSDVLSSSIKTSTENGGSSSQYLVGGLQQKSVPISNTINVPLNSSSYTSTMPHLEHQCQDPSSKQNQLLIPPSSTTYSINQRLLSASTSRSKEFLEIQMDQEKEPKINNNLPTSIKDCSTQITIPLSLPPLGGPYFTPTLMPVSSALSTTTTTTAVFKPTNFGGLGRLTYSSPIPATTYASACPPPVKLNINNSFLFTTPMEISQYNNIPSSGTTNAANSTPNSCSLGGCASTTTAIIYNAHLGVSSGSPNSSFFTNINNLSSLSATINSNVSSQNGFRTISNSIKSLSFPTPTYHNHYHHNHNSSEKRLKLDIVTTTCCSSSTNEKPPQLIFVSSTSRSDLIYNDATTPNLNNSTQTNPAIQAFLSALPKDGTKPIPIHQRFTAGIGNEDTNTLFYRERCNDVSNGNNIKILNNEDPSSIQHINRSFIGNTTGSGPRFPGVGVFSELSGDALLGAVIAHQINQNVSDAESIELWNPLKHTI